MASPSRNQACLCGSGKKYKHCCAQAAATTRPAAGQPGLIRLETGQLLPISQAMAHAIQLHQAGRIRKAEALYRQIVHKQPGHADAQHLLGLVCHQTGKHELAYTHITRAISLNVNAALFHNNLGEVCRALNKLDEAQACYARAVALQPTLLEAHRNIGLTLHAQNKPDQADAYLRQLITRHPKYLGGYWALLTVLKDQKKTDEILIICDAGLEHNPLDLSLLHAKGHTLRLMGQLEQSARHYRQAIEQQPQMPELYRYLTVVLMQSGDTAGAIEGLKNEIRLSPDDTSAQHLLASLQNITTDRAPASYVSELFNTYADSFDQHLVGKLEYRTHALVAQTILDTLGNDAHGLDILDLGCGTGLFGEEAKDIKKTLVGIDLASKMIDLARQRGIYDELIVGDLVDYLVEVQPSQFDLVVATDVFVYIGDLLPVFRQISRILQPGRWFAFSLEAAAEADQDFTLGLSGRYQHSQNYIERLCTDFKFEIDRFTQTTIRKDHGRPIAGYIYLLRKTALPANPTEKTG
jgi:predicted TPR repeat methyltransferase/TolA-binding protein